MPHLSRPSAVKVVQPSRWPNPSSSLTRLRSSQLLVGHLPLLLFRLKHLLEAVAHVLLLEVVEVGLAGVHLDVETTLGACNIDIVVAFTRNNAGATAGVGGEGVVTKPQVDGEVTTDTTGIGDLIMTPAGLDISGAANVTKFQRVGAVPRSRSD